jgi:two-component system alkaline phosphatase synthesis response regulator PhoP
MSQGRLLVVEDDHDISNMLKIYFTGQGYDVGVAPRAGQALKMVQQQLPQLIVLDILLPDMDGYTLCKTLRTHPRTKHIPIIFLTQKDERSDKIAGLELGADDYITKPFSPRELVARVRAVLRRVRGGVRQPGLIRAAELEIDLQGHRVTRAGEPIDLTRTEFNLLATLAQHPGQTFTRAQLLDRLHGYAYEGYDRSVDAHVKNLRRKLEVNPVEPRYVLTVYGVGYKFTDEV